MAFSGLQAKAVSTTNFAATVKDKQFHAVKMSDDWEVDAITAVTDRPLGILTDNPQKGGDGATVATAEDSIMKAKSGGVCTAGNFLKVTADGSLVNLADPVTGAIGASTAFAVSLEWAVAIALEDAVDDDIFMVKPITPQPIVKVA